MNPSLVQHKVHLPAFCETFPAKGGIFGCRQKLYLNVSFSFVLCLLRFFQTDYDNHHEI